MNKCERGLEPTEGDGSKYQVYQVISSSEDWDLVYQTLSVIAALRHKCGVRDRLVPALSRCCPC